MVYLTRKIMAMKNIFASIRKYGKCRATLLYEEDIKVVDATKV